MLQPGEEVLRGPTDSQCCPSEFVTSIAENRTVNGQGGEVRGLVRLTNVVCQVGPVRSPRGRVGTGDRISVQDRREGGCSCPGSRHRQRRASDGSALSDAFRSRFSDIRHTRASSDSIEDIAQQAKHLLNEFRTLNRTLDRLARNGDE